MSTVAHAGTYADLFADAGGELNEFAFLARCHVQAVTA